jgi:hypothetical protein
MSEALRVTINPANQRIDIRNLRYVGRWVEAFEAQRASFEEEIKEKVDRGELTVTTDSDDPKMDTPERAIHFMAHAAAENSMQRWAMLRGIGLPGDKIIDHGQEIIYELDPSVPPLEYQAVEA